MQHHFTPTAKDQLKRRHHDRLRRIAQAHHRLLKETANHVQLFPVLILRFHQHEHQVRAHRKVLALIADYQSQEILFDFGQRYLQHLERVAPDRVHLRMKLETGHTIAQINQRGAGVISNDACAIFQRLQNDRAREIRGWKIFCGREVKIEALAVLMFVERLRA